MQLTIPTGLEKKLPEKVVFLEFNDHIEIWSTEEFQRYRNKFLKNPKLVEATEIVCQLSRKEPQIDKGDFVKQEEWHDNWHPIESIIKVADKVMDNELKLDFWGSLFLKTFTIIGIIVICLGSLATFMSVLMLIIGLFYK